MVTFLSLNKATDEAISAESQVPASMPPVPAKRQTAQASKSRAQKPQTPSKPRVRETSRPVTPVAPRAMSKETEIRPVKPPPNAPTDPITANRPKSILPEPALAPNMTDEPETHVIQDSSPAPRSEEAPEPAPIATSEEPVTDDSSAVAAITAEDSPPSDDEGAAPPSTHTKTAETQKRAAVILLPDRRKPNDPAPKPVPVRTTVTNKDENSDLIVLPLPSGMNGPVSAQPSDTSVQMDREEVQLASIAPLLPAPKASPPPPKLPTVEFDAGGMWLAQIGAYSDAGTACEIWFDLSETWPNLFMRAERNVSVTDRRGALIYRLRAGAFPDRTNAKRFCEIIIADGGDCFVVKRG